MVGKVESMAYLDAHAGDPGLGPDSKVRTAGGEHGEAAPRMLAFDCVGRGPGKIRPACKATIKCRL